MQSPRKAKPEDIDISRLCKAVSRARLSLHYPREARATLVRLVAGPAWSEETGKDKKQPLNLLDLYLTIVGRSLIAKNPRINLSTFQRSNKPAVATMQAWANTAIEQMHLDETLKRVVTDAMYSVGILKVALGTPSDAANVGWNAQAGKPFAQRVSLDDFVYDIHARDFREAGFVGHRFRTTLRSVADSENYDREVRSQLQPSYDRTYNEQGDERASVLGRGYYSAMEEFEDMVDLWEIYLPRHRRVLTLVADDGGTPREDLKPLRDIPWLGPADGPYHFLCLKTVPDNAMPKGPLQDLADLHEAVNKTYRKLVRQSDRQKELLAVQGTADGDGSRIMEAPDGEVIRVDNPDKMKPMAFGGANQANIAFGSHLKDLFDFLAGGLSLMGGLAPQSKTLGQDKMLNDNASAGISSMQDDTTNFVGSVCKALCWYWWHDPQSVMSADYQVPGLPEATVQRRVTPQQRQQVPWEQLQVKVDPYSLRNQTPQQRVASLMQLMQTVVMPMQQLLQQQGVMVDMNAFLTKLAGYMDMPDLTDILSIQEPPAQSGQAGGSSDGPKMPNQTSREYVRRSIGADNPASRNADLMNNLQKNQGRPEQPQGTA